MEQRAKIELYFRCNCSVTAVRRNYRNIYCIESPSKTCIKTLHEISRNWNNSRQTAHTAKETMQMLKAIFPNRLIYRFGDIPWLPRSPDLNAPDFFLWGYLKEKVYIEMPDTLKQLKRNIIQEINNISQETLMKVMNSTVERARQCLTNNGGHLKDIVLHT